MSVFIWPNAFEALVKWNQRGIDEHHGPTGHCGCAEESCLALAVATETYIHLGICWRTETQTHRHIKQRGQTCIVSTGGDSKSKHP